VWTVSNGQFVAHLPAGTGNQNRFYHLIEGLGVGKRGAAFILVGQANF
jgi:hypothetical protein